MRLEHLQRSMAAAILQESTGWIAAGLVAGRADPATRFRVYANNTAHSLTQALRANFPVTVALLGDRFFEQVARAFIRRHPPREPRLAHYGDGLPRFIASNPACREMRFIARVTLLEALILESLRSPVHPRITPACVPVPTVDVGVLLNLQPSLRLMRSTFDAMAIWRAHQDGTALSPALGSPGRHFLQIVRAGDSISTRALSAGSFAFRHALRSSHPLHVAAERAYRVDGAFDLQRELSDVFVEGLVQGTSLRPDPRQ